jgi:hypothetical protein
MQLAVLLLLETAGSIRCDSLSISLYLSLSLFLSLSSSLSLSFSLIMFQQQKTQGLDFTHNTQPSHSAHRSIYKRISPSYLDSTESASAVHGKSYTHYCTPHSESDVCFAPGNENSNKIYYNSQPLITTQLHDR